MSKVKDNRQQILVYGAESLGYKFPSDPIDSSHYILKFGKVNTEDDLSDYDGVIFFANIFENYEHSKIFCSDSDKGQMLKRIKQLHKLLDKGGFVGVLTYKLIDEYTTSDHFNSYSHESFDTSLGKVLLNDLGIDKRRRKYSKAPLKLFKSFRDEFKTYLADYGVTQTYFDFYSSESQIKPICTLNDHHYFVGLIFDDRVFVLPCHAEDKDEKSTVKLFDTVAKAIVTTLPKLAQEIPAWVDHDFVFQEETRLLTELKKQKEILSDIETAIATYKNFKGALIFSADSLVANVGYILENFLQIKVSRIEEYKEDLKLLQDANLIAIVEVKGVNSGVKREHISQVDINRERQELAPDFPALLIINTKMAATSLKDKDLQVASELIKKAVTDKVLIVRTLDLLNLIKLVEISKISKGEILRIFKEEHGWLKATEETFEIMKA